MKTLTIINTITLSLIVALIFYREIISRIEINIRRTTWEKKSYGIELIWWKYPRKLRMSNSGKIHGFNWRDPNKISDDISKKKS
jgi:hypothetical protein